MTTERTLDRRTVLRVAGAGAVAALAGCTNSGGDPEGGDDTTTPSDAGTNGYDGWLSDTSNYEETVDRTGQDAVTVEVGTSGNMGNNAFSPAAVRVSTGTSVTWEWTGQGGYHNVVANDGSFESDQYEAEGETFEHTFDSAGTYKYYCSPHKVMGMKGVVVVE